MNKIIPLSTEYFEEAYVIEQQAHHFPWTWATFLQNQGSNFHNLAIISDEKLAGFTICQFVLDEASLFNLAIDPQQQKKGLGQRLITQLIEALIEREIQTLWLEVRASNDTAIRLYDKLGFNQISVRPDYYPSNHGREDAILMALTL